VQQRATRPRPLTEGQEHRLKALRHIAHLLDSAFVVPGTGYRIGLDPILGLVPGLGDLASPLFAIALLWQSRDLGIPRVVQLRNFDCGRTKAPLASTPYASSTCHLPSTTSPMRRPAAILRRNIDRPCVKGTRA